jgi:hypothetical protein
MYVSFRVQLHGLPDDTDIVDLAEQLRNVLDDEFEPEFPEDIQLYFEDYE